MRLINKIFNESTEDISGILADLERIRAHSDLVNCVFRATGSSWLGVNIAGRSMFPDQTIEVPQFHSAQVLTDLQIEQLYHTIAKLGFKQFVFHGFSPYISKIICGLKERDHNIQVLLIHHGFISELSENDFQIHSTMAFITLCREGKIDKLGVVKKGHEMVFKEIFNIDVHLLYNRVPILEVSLVKMRSRVINIGVLVNNSFRKNLHCQVIAALMIENVMVHVLEKRELNYLPDQSRIIEHGMMPHNEFMALVAAMDINLHITYSESFGGQVFTESLGYGVPCLTGYTNGFLDSDPELKLLLSVSETDDPLAISKRIREILPLRHNLSRRLVAHCKEMNKLADDCLNSFLHS
jgi:glycosyltransferase involved in cell wall biosynthesis